MVYLLFRTILKLSAKRKHHTYSANEAKPIFVNIYGISRNILKHLSCFCFHYRGLKARTGTASENRCAISDPPAAIGKKQPRRHAAERSRRPFTLPFPPTPGGTEHLTMDGGIQSLQGGNKACWDREEQRAAFVHDSEGTQDSTSCYRAGWNGFGHN